jgi:hypothetical protein
VAHKERTLIKKVRKETILKFYSLGSAYASIWIEVLNSDHHEIRRIEEVEMRFDSGSWIQNE